MITLGVDYDSRGYHVVLLNKERVAQVTDYAFDVKNDEDLLSTAFLVSALESDYYTIESPLYVRNYATAFLLSRVCYALEFAWASQGKEYMELAASQWRRLAIGHGSISKQGVKEWATTHFNYEFETDHQSDAACIALARQKMEER